MNREGKFESAGATHLRGALHLRMALALAALLLIVGGAMAQSPTQDYDLSWWTVDGGGGTLAGGEYSLGGTAGQSDAGVLEGGCYTLAGGFWRGGVLVSQPHRIYLPLLLRNG